MLLGRYPSAELKTAATLAALPPPVPAELPAQLLERRPDVMAAEYTFNAAFHLVQASKAARLPSISLTGAGGYSTSGILQDLNYQPWLWTAAANMLDSNLHRRVSGGSGQDRRSKPKGGSLRSTDRLHFTVDEFGARFRATRAFICCDRGVK